MSPPSPERASLLSDIRYMREIMELSTEHRLLPDWAAITGGILVLVSTAVTWSFTRSGDVKEVLFLPPAEKAVVSALWVGTALASVLLYWWLATREARRLGVSLQSRPTQLARQAMGPAILAATVLTLRLVGDRHYGFIPGAWILLYGIGLYNAGLFSTEEPRLLGLLFMVTGIVSILVLPEIDLWLTALSFGGYHIAFGLYALRAKRA